MNNSDWEEESRRPLSVRNYTFIKRFATWLSRKNITPNQISLMSIVFAILGACAGYAYFASSNVFFLLLIAVCIQLRLLCNLFDGMVAVEGQKKTPAGELFNDVPDRISDPILILAAGLVTVSDVGLSLAWLSALVAILTAYVRILGCSMGCPADFRGPMAKQHRMALLTVTLVVLFFHHSFNWLPLVFDYSMDIALMVMFLGGLYTTWRRLTAIYSYKKQTEFL